MKNWFDKFNAGLRGNSGFGFGRDVPLGILKIVTHTNTNFPRKSDPLLYSVQIGLIWGQILTKILAQIS